MDKKFLMDNGVDYDEGVHRFSGKALIYEKFILKFPNDPAFANLQAAMEAGDVDAAFKAAHMLKGTAGNLSIRSIMLPLVPMVEALRAGNLELAREYNPMVAESYEKVCSAIESQR